MPQFYRPRAPLFYNECLRLSKAHDTPFSVDRISSSMLKTSKIKVDDKLLELISADSLRVNRFGLYVTVAAIVFILILCTTSLWFIDDESRKLEVSAQTALNQSIARQFEERSLALAHSLDAPAHRFYQTEDCEAFSVVFALHPALREVILAQPDGSVRAACRGHLYSEMTPRAVGTSIADQHATQDAVAFSIMSEHPVFSEPYIRQHRMTAYADLVIPISTGESVIASLSLTRLLRDLAGESNLQAGYRLDILVDGKSFPPSLYAPIPEGSVSVETQLSPLPYNISFVTTNTTPKTFLVDSTPAKTIIVLALGLLFTLTLLLRYQLRQIRSETELRARVAIQKTFNDSITDGLLVVGLTSRVLFSNTAFDKLFGYKEESPVGLSVREAIGVSVGDPDPQRFHEGKVVELEYRARRRDGSEFDCHVSVIPLKPIEGRKKSTGWLVALRDVTEQRRARLALATEHERTVLIIESMNAAVSVVHLEENNNELLYANALYCKYWGQSVEGHIRIRDLFNQASAVGHTAEIHDKKNGRWLSVTRSVLPWPGKGASEMLAVTDITDRKEVENLMQVQAKAAESASHLITMGEMASSLAHELNQPLAAVQNYASATLTMMQKGRTSEDRVAEALTKIINQTQRAAYIIRRIRGFAKAKGGEANIASVTVDKIVAATMELALIQAKRFGMKIKVSILCPGHELVCDAVMIEQVLLNLLKNAMEASQETDSETVEFNVNANETQTIFEVADHGCGMPVEPDKVFTPFFTTKVTGMGIGLNICRSVVESHRGRIVISENTGGGTIIRVLLPNSTFASTETSGKTGENSGTAADSNSL